MKRTNPNKGRNEDPGFVPISWDEALDTVAARLNGLRERGEVASLSRCSTAAAGGLLRRIARHVRQLYGSPNVAIGHSSMCSDGSIKAKQFTDGNASLQRLRLPQRQLPADVRRAGFLEAFRPYNNNMQVWGYIRGARRRRPASPPSTCMSTRRWPRPTAAC
jgi:thiosulfate reductase / polysulfide reductase chain A